MAVPFGAMLRCSVGQVATAILPPRALPCAKMPAPKRERTYFTQYLYQDTPDFVDGQDKVAKETETFQTANAQNLMSHSITAAK